MEWSKSHAAEVRTEAMPATSLAHLREEMLEELVWLDHTCGSWHWLVNRIAIDRRHGPV